MTKYILEEFINNSYLINSKSFIQNNLIKKKLRKYVYSQLEYLLSIIENIYSITTIGGESYLYGLELNHKIKKYNYTNNKYILSDIKRNSLYQSQYTISNIIDYNIYDDYVNTDILIINLSKLNKKLLTEINKRYYKYIIIINCHHSDFWKKIKLISNYQITNRKKFINDKLKYFVSVTILKYKYKNPIFISFGYNCAVSYHLKRLGLKIFKMPFDWVRINNFNNVNKVILTDFKDFNKLKYIKSSSSHKYLDTNDNSLHLKNRYHINFYHEVKSKDKINEFENELYERINNFRNIKNNKNNKIFIIILNDFKKNINKNIIHSYLNCDIEFIYIDIQSTYKENIDIDWRYENYNWKDKLFNLK